MLKSTGNSNNNSNYNNDGNITKLIANNVITAKNVQNKDKKAY